MSSYNSILALIGKTPLLCLRHISERYGCAATIWAKAEGLNPSGSTYDRVALFTLREAIASGQLQENGTILLHAWGALAKSYALCAAALGLRCSLIIPDDTPSRVAEDLKAYGAEVTYVPAGDPDAPARRAELLRQRREHCWEPPVWNNESAILAHRETTAREILEDMPELTDLVCGSCTGAAITGIGESLKAQLAEVRIVCAEPAESPVISGGPAAPSPIPGFGAGLVPENLNPFILDEVIRVKAEDAKQIAAELAALEGILCREADGAALCAALDLACRPESAGRNILVLLPTAGR